MTPRARRLVALVTLSLALAVIGVLTLRAFGVPLALGPLASQTPTPPVTPAPSIGASPSLEEALAALEAGVADIRDLPTVDIGPPEFISRDELERRLADELAEEYPPQEAAADNVLYQALGLLAPGQDKRGLR